MPIEFTILPFYLSLFSHIYLYKSSALTKYPGNQNWPLTFKWSKVANDSNNGILLPACFATNH